MHRRHRLRSRSDFARVMRSGRRTSGRGLVVHHVVPGAADVARIGFSTGRALGGAVVRNRTRRRLREAIRPLIEQLPAADVVVVARRDAAELRPVDLGQAVRDVLTRAGMLGQDRAADVGGTMGEQDPPSDVTEGTPS